MVTEAETPWRVPRVRSRGGTCAGLLAVCPARIIHRDRRGRSTTRHTPTSGPLSPPT